MTENPIPTLRDVIAARPNVYRFLRPTALHHYPGLSQLIGAEVWVKHENHQPVGAFKVRGGLHLAASLSDEEKRNGLYTASTGNHGQSIAYEGECEENRKRLHRSVYVKPDTKDANEMTKKGCKP